MNRKRLRVILAFILIGGGVFMWFNASNSQNPTPVVTENNKPKTSFTFANPWKSKHYVSNIPAHESVLPGAPLNVVVDFNSDLVAQSAISVTLDGKEYGSNTTVNEANMKSMRRKVDPKAPDGIYTVNYRVCVTDTNCSQGSFQFAIDRTLASTYTDMRDQKEVTIRMKDNTFSPVNVRVSKDTRVIWVNEDNTDHFVNADPYPTHSYLPGMNSTSIVKGATYTFLFDLTGFFPYHDNIRPDNMKGAVLAE